MKNKARGPHQAKNKPIPTDDVILGQGAVQVANPRGTPDERKSMVLNKDLKDLEFEDKVWLWWRDNKNFVIFTVFVAFAIIIGVQGWRWFENQQTIAVQKAYLTVTDNDSLLAFAQENASSPLAGVAALRLADEAYDAGNFVQSADFYAKASESLANTTMFSRARLGLAFALLNADKIEEGKKALQEIVNDKTAHRAFHAQASYHLGVLTFDEGGKEILSNLQADETAGVWASMAEQFLSVR